MSDILKSLNEHGIWDMLQCAGLLSAAIVVCFYLWFPRRRVTNLNFHVTTSRDNDNYPLKIRIEIRNFTGRAVVISHPTFKFRALRPHAQAHGHSATGEYEVKFPGVNAGLLTEVEYLLRHGEHVNTWIPLDPAHTDEQAAAATQTTAAGVLVCTCTWFGTWLSDKPTSHTLKSRI